jgi:hypothetical protein
MPPKIDEIPSLKRQYLYKLGKINYSLVNKTNIFHLEDISEIEQCV